MVQPIQHRGQIRTPANLEFAMGAPLVTIIIDNYNYARFLQRSINSALAQTYPHVQVVVVDDASTDGSQELIQSFGRRVTPIFKTVNAGHGAAFNSGFAASRGDIVIFLDADDHLYPRAVERVVGEFASGVAKAQFRLDLVDATGRVTIRIPRPRSGSTAATLSRSCYRPAGTRVQSRAETPTPGACSIISCRCRRGASVKAATGILIPLRRFSER